MKFKLKVITHYFHVLEFTRDEAPKDTSKIEQV
jgi:hypothetical protein